MACLEGRYHECSTTAVRIIKAIVQRARNFELLRTCQKFLW